MRNRSIIPSDDIVNGEWLSAGIGNPHGSHPRSARTVVCRRRPDTDLGIPNATCILMHKRHHARRRRDAIAITERAQQWILLLYDSNRSRPTLGSIVSHGYVRRHRRWDLVYGPTPSRRSRGRSVMHLLCANNIGRGAAPVVGRGVHRRSTTHRSCVHGRVTGCPVRRSVVLCSGETAVVG